MLSVPCFDFECATTPVLQKADVQHKWMAALGDSTRAVKTAIHTRMKKAIRVGQFML